MAHTSDPASRAPSDSPSSVALLGAFLGCALVWGSTFLAISIGNDAMPPFWAATVRHALAAPLLVLIALVARQSLPRGAALRAAALYGFFAFGLALVFLYWAERRVPSGLAAVLYATTPLINMFLTRAFGLERITVLKFVAATVALFGVVVLFSSQLDQRVSTASLLAMLGAATCSGLGAVLLKRGPRQNPIGSNAVASVIGFFVCLVATMAAREPHPIPRTAAELLPILYLVVAGSVVAFVLFAWLVNHWDVTRISFVSVIVPVIALALGAIVRHERLTAMSLVGSGLVLGGVLLRISGDRPRGTSSRASLAATNDSTAD